VALGERQIIDERLKPIFMGFYFYSVPSSCQYQGEMKKKFKKTNIEWDIKDMERREYNKNVMS
jgi:hypothetical protein